EDAVIYQVFIDRFAGFDDKSNWHNPEFVGGDIQGIIDKLDYIEKLGVDVLWISPFYQGESYHGYHITDMFSVDDNFGDEEDLKELIDEVHSRDMRIIADFVPNHVSVEHEYFKDAQSNPASDYRDWFYFNDWPDDFLSFLDFDDFLVKLNLENPEAREHVLDAAEKWVGMGLDGFRVDHVIGVPDSFWRDLEERIGDDKVLIGEAVLRGVGRKHLDTLKAGNIGLFITLKAQGLLQRHYKGLMDGVLDFKGLEILYRVLNSSWIPSSLAENLFNIHQKFYPENFLLANFLDNHDMDRALYRFNNDKEKFKQAYRILLENKQPTIIYYGDEIGMTQSHSIHDFEKHGDLQARQPMKWNDKDKELLKFFQNQIKDS
ncbi:MAG: alpha-amylase family glycosyl hydrolase, partial [Candidatus Nanohaloarchaea archaeon]